MKRSNIWHGGDNKAYRQLVVIAAVHCCLRCAVSHDAQHVKGTQLWRKGLLAFADGETCISSLCTCLQKQQQEDEGEAEGAMVGREGSEGRLV